MSGVLAMMLGSGKDNSPPTGTISNPSGSGYVGSTASHDWVLTAVAGNGGSVVSVVWDTITGTVESNGGSVSFNTSTSNPTTVTISGLPANSTQYYTTIRATITLSKSGQSNTVVTPTEILYYTRTP